MVENETHYRINKINRIENYFITKIQEKETISKTLSKYIPAFDYFDKTLLVLSAISRTVFIDSLVTVIGAPVEITSINLSLVFSISNRIAKKTFKLNEKRRERNTIKLF